MKGASKNNKKAWTKPEIKVLKINVDTKTGIWQGKKENSPKFS
jgi:hypothetical protein